MPPWEDLLAAYMLSPRSEQVERARRMFRRLRRVAYLGLDTQYAPAAVTLDLGRVLADERTLERHALADRSADEAELVALDAHMARTVYLGRSVLTAMACRESRLRTDIRSVLRTEQMPALIERLAAGELQKDLPKRDLVSAVRILFQAHAPLDVFMTEGTNARREEVALRAELRARGGVGVPVIWAVPERNEWVVQVHVSRSSARDAARAVSAVMARLANYRHRIQARLDFLEDYDIQALLFGPMARDLIEAALAAVFGDEMRWEWGVTVGPQAVLATRARARDLVQREVRAMSARPDAAPRRAELELLYNMLLGNPDREVVAAIASVRGFKGDARTPIVEIDAVAAEEYNGRLRVHVGEAKTGSGSATAARTQLRKSLQRLSVHDDVSIAAPRLVAAPLRRTQVRVRSRASATLAI